VRDELRIGETVAWKALRVAGPPAIPRLFSFNHSRPMVERCWPTGQWFRARCSSKHARPESDDPIPGSACQCGVYAAVSWKELVNQNYAEDGMAIVVAKVALAGRIQPGEKAHRASRARILELFVPYEHWRWAAPLGAAYGVPVSLARMSRPVDLEEAAVGHGDS